MLTVDALTRLHGIFLVCMWVRSRACARTVCVFVCPSSPIQEHGSGGAVSAVQALFSSGPGEGAEGRLAEETEEHHEELAAALVRAAARSPLLL